MSVHAEGCTAFFYRAGPVPAFNAPGFNALFSSLPYCQSKEGFLKIAVRLNCAGSTPRTPAAAAAASGNEKLYKVAPGGDYENSEYSSSDDDTSYGGKPV